ncbi:MAG: T9SS type A sorting domain-containing protein [Phaeodactylibacter sp.]|nr:T9SS type A sorting domain-containing protein [Phaeodactylibacter sp.]MCB9050626.1 T9SS type A sorting domain-containing protein [Lewinellaceae bacterium]
MNSKFTQLLVSVMGTLVLLLATYSLSAQVIPLKIRINNPEAQGLVIDATRANFGPMPPAEITADLAWATDGVTAPTDNDTWSPTGSYCCEAVVNGDEISGKIAMISRGSCEFGVKVKNAEDEGAVAVIIANRAPIGLTVGTHTDGTVWMGAGAVGDSTTVPSMFITYEDRKTLEDLMAVAGGTLNVTIMASHMYDASAAHAALTPELGVPMDSIQVVLVNRDTAASALVTDIQLTATITEPGGGTEVLTATLDTLFSLGIEGFSYEQRTFFPSYTPTEAGLYTIVFSASTPNGDHPLDSETITQTFEVNPETYTYRIDNGELFENFSVELNEAAYQSAASSLIFNVGAMYRTGDNPAAAAFASFILNNASELTPGMEFTLALMDADPDGDGSYDNNFDGATDRTDFLEVGSVIYEVSGDEPAGELLLVEFDSPIALEANKTYLLMVSHSGLESDNFFPPKYGAAGAQNQTEYGTVYEIGLVGGEGYEFDLDGFEYWNDDTPNWPHGGLHPVVRLHTVGFTNTENLPVLEDGKFTILGNPAKEVLNVGFQLDTPADEVRLVVLDMLGHVVSSQRMENVLNETHTLNIQGLAAGTYIVTAITPEGYRTKKFVVAR